MKPKTIVAAVLALFVSASVAYLIFGGGSRAARTAAVADIRAEAAAGTPRPNETAKKAVIKTVVYYFHSSFRCRSCQKIEELTARAIGERFSSDLASGSMVWSPVNTELPQNRHFVDDFQLFTKSVVVAVMDRGKPVRWKNLSRIWELLGDDRAFENYINTEVSEFRNGN